MLPPWLWLVQGCAGLLLCWSWCGGRGSWAWHLLYLQEEEFSCSDAPSCRPILQLLHGQMSPSFFPSYSDSHSNPITLFFSCSLFLLGRSLSSLFRAQAVYLCVCKVRTHPEKLQTRKECSQAAGWLEYSQLGLISHKPPWTAQPGDRILACSLRSLVMLSALCK